MNGLLSPVLRHIRLTLVARYAKGRVLDYGCNDGTLIDYLPASEYTGVDISYDALKRGMQKHPHTRFLHVNELDKVADRFDTVTSIATLGLIDDKKSFLKAMRDCLNDNGQIVLTTPHPRVNWVHQLGHKIGLFGNDGYKSSEQLLDRKSMATLAAEAGLSVAKVRYFMLGMNQLFILVPSTKRT